MNLLVKTLNTSEIKDLKDAFESMDEDNNGYLSKQELLNALKSPKMKLSQDKIKKALEEIEFSDTGEINYSEFIAATISTKMFLNEDRLYMIFKEFDIDDSEFITLENMKNSFQKLNKPISKKELEEIMKAHGKSSDGKISFEEFKEIMMDEDGTSATDLHNF